MSRLQVLIPAIVAAALAGCAADGTPMLSTSAIGGTAPAKVEKAAAVDPVCVALSNQIDNLRKEGSIDGLEKAAEGKGASVKVKRQSLAKQAELNRTYAEFQAKCGPRLPLATTAQVSQVPATKPLVPTTPVPAARP